MVSLNISLSFEEISHMQKKRFKSIVKDNIRESSLKYLLKLRKFKGANIEYSRLCMAEYLMPNELLTIQSDKQLMFSIRNNMINISENFPKSVEDKCICSNRLTMEHIYKCEHIKSSHKPDIKYEKIFNGSLSEQVQIFKLLKDKLSILNIQK